MIYSILKMDELPLFPLNMVLFPGTPLMLHIFESRYIEMIQTCLNEDGPFGVLLIQRGREALGPVADTYDIGCLANILRVERLSGGRMNILAVGGKRFRVNQYHRGGDYLTGDIKHLKLRDEDPDALVEQCEQLRPWIQNYVDLLRESNLIQSQPYTLPDDPIDLVYTGAYLLQVSPRQKQSLLELNDGLQLVDAVRDFYRREISLTRTLIDAPKAKPGVAGRLN